MEFKNIEKTKPNKIASLSVLKFVAMLLIVWWHIGIHDDSIDLGARMCEFLFVASGFLVGYNYFHKGMPTTFDYSFKYLFGKIKKVWPLHIICLFAFMILNYKTCILNFTWSSLPTFFANLFLLQSWSPDIGNVAFSYNGVSWFLSSLLFCYFLSPILMKFVKNKRISIPLFFLVAFIRICIDISTINSCNIFYLQIHTSPIVRCLEFFMGMLMIPLFFWIKEKVSKIKGLLTIASIIEIGLLISLYFILKTFNTTWLRSYFVIIFCIVVFVFALDAGCFSALCSNKYISMISNIQLEVYLLQIVINLSVTKFLIAINLTLNHWIVILISFTFLIIVSILYKVFIENKLALILDNICTKIIKNSKNNFSIKFKKVTLKNKSTFQKVYITALTQGFDPFVPMNFINNFNKNFDEYFLEIFNDKNTFLYICYEGKIPVGVIVFGKSTLDDSIETDGFLDSIYFLKEYHGKGLAKQALEFLEEKLKSLNYKKVFLWCSKENKRAWKFYTKHNYTPLENKTWDDTLDGKVFHNILFVKDI